MEDPELQNGEVDFMTKAEESFWKDLIAKYLYPIDANKDEQVCLTYKKKARKNLFFVFFTYSHFCPHFAILWPKITQILIVLPYLFSI
jgi:hypothetical protein